MFANVALLSWPIVVAILVNKKTVPVAIITSILAGYLLLPEQTAFDLPLLPTLEKDTIPAISILVLIALLGAGNKSRALEGWLPRGFIPKIFLLLLVLGAFFTTITNNEALIYGPLFIPALRPYDAFSTILSNIMVILPFFLARKFLAYPEHNKIIISAFVLAGLCYSILALYEVRMSPQLSRIVYGFFPHSWLQHVRANGFRPIVFLEHGLWVSIFFTCTVLAAAGLVRMALKGKKTKPCVCFAWLLFTLVLTKSLGALTIALILLPCVFFLKPRLQILLCATFAVLIMVYPALRFSDAIPVEYLVKWAEDINAERAGSLQFRLDNEDILLAKANEKPLFGWGGWGRSSVFDQTGREISTPDGYWVIMMGIGGWTRYIASFGLLCTPIIIFALKGRKSQLGLESSIVVLMLTANLIDLIPNATATPLTWMLAGAVWGRLELKPMQLASSTTDNAKQIKREIRYTRFN